MRILLVLDREGWALETLARHIVAHYGHLHDFTVRAVVDQSFDSWFASAQRSFDIIHFLANRAFHRYGFRTSKPLIFNLNHVDGGWHEVDRNIYLADIICVSSDQWIEKIKRRYGFNSDFVKRIVFGVDTDVLVPSQTAKDEYKRTRRLSQETCVFGFSVAKAKRKGIDKLWNCFRALRTRSSIPFVIRITGRGWCKDDVPSDMTGIAFIEGMLPSSAMPDFFSSLDFYVCTSDIEGGPYPVMESMSCGVTVLTTPVGVTPELIEHAVNGFFLDPKNLEYSFVKNVTSVAGNPERKKLIGCAARDTIVGRHAIDKAMMYSCYNEVYATAVANHTRRDFTSKVKKHAFSTLSRISGRLASNVREFRA